MAAKTQQDLEWIGEAAEHWWLLLLEGAALALIGWWLLTQPVSTTLILVQVLGLYWLIAGIIDVIVSIFDSSGDSRVWRLFGGVIGIIAGLFVLNNALFAGLITPTIFLWVIALTFVVQGVVKIFLGNKEADVVGYERSWGSFFTGLFYLLFGIVLLTFGPLAKFSTMIITTGIMAMLGGIGMIYFSFKLKAAKPKK